jgi:putative isomerase
MNPRLRFLALGYLVFFCGMDIDIRLTAAEVPHAYTGNIQFGISKAPFSRYGSYMAFSHVRQSEGLPEGVYLRNLHGGVNRREVFRLEVLQGQNPVAFQELATPTSLRLKANRGEVELIFAEPSVIRFRSKNVGLRLTMVPPSRTFAFALTYDNALAVDATHWEVNNFSQQMKYMLTGLRGKLAVDAPWHLIESEHVVADFLPDSQAGISEGAIEEFRSVWQPRDYSEDFDDVAERLRGEYRQWLAKMPAVPESFAEAGELAAYVDWASVVAPEGFLTRPTMFMSKNWMTNIWSWDHCFNAMALTYGNPQLAWDQLMVIMDSQDPNGAFPDIVNDRGRIWNFSKPPVHGWTLRWMMKHTDFINLQRLAEVYSPMSRWTDWYFKYRDYDGDGIPQYNHGNDSGWDNATVFRGGPPVESPDLSAFLVVQMDVLADLARRLGKENEAREWSRRADDLLSRLLAHSWREDHFVAPLSGSHKVVDSQSLLLYLPILLGERLPELVRSKLIDGVKAEGRLLTPYGLATEELRSPHYESDGYWLGPIWAPSTLIIADGLEAAGEKTLARDLKLRFCRLVAKSGMAENFDARTGAGLRDPAYTWTSSVFLIVAHELLEPESR